MTENNNIILACSECFEDQGLRLDATLIGESSNEVCPRCNLSSGRKLSAEVLGKLAHRFFVWGSLRRCEFGAAPLIQFNEHQKTSITLSPWLLSDVKIFEETLGIGFFAYGPRLWMIGEIEQLTALKDETQRLKVIDQILDAYPTRVIDSGNVLYRIRKAPKNPQIFTEYDSPPQKVSIHGRLDSDLVGALYVSEELSVCVHECRVTAEDELYVATLRPKHPLKMLDLTVLLREGNVTEFESLDLTVHMLFLAGTHSYPITSPDFSPR